MKRIVGLVVLMLICYVIYYDLSYGTLPIAVETTANVQPDVQLETEAMPTIRFFEKKVENGDTVLSIIERQLNGPLPVSIEAVITDFQMLNNGLEPQKIQYGQVYKFPNYEESAH